MTRKISLFVIFILQYFIAVAQDADLSAWPKDILQQANTAKNADYLSEQEKLVIFYVNLARLDGKLFAKTILEEHVVKNELDKDDKYIKSLYEDLKKSGKKDPLLPSEKLSKAAKYHAKDIGKKGLVSHNSSDGTSFSKRVLKYSPDAGAMAENCSFGDDNNYGLMVVLQLLIDDGVPSYGHRINILSNDYKYIGTSIQEHSKWGFTCVQDFAYGN